MTDNGTLATPQKSRQRDALADAQARTRRAYRKVERLKAAHAAALRAAQEELTAAVTTQRRIEDAALVG